MEFSFEKGKFSEKELENAIIELFKEQNYTHVFGDEIHRQHSDILVKYHYVFLIPY